jgi:rhamnopyranosyl-N-acetylglucosaminyl-diphospho-decaprenol beta-1,3/1,4-galactofuranosyltransferase
MMTCKKPVSGKRETVAAVVVTYNRKHLLVRCLNAVLEQSRRPDAIILVDNASTDGTWDLLAKTGYLENVRMDYIRLTENTGGAGGFYAGTKRGYEKGFDWLWLMDDDGMPDKYCLETLMSCSRSGAKQEIISPIVISLDNDKELAFFLMDDRTGTRTRDVRMVRSCSVGGRIWGFANLFNGAIIGKGLIENIGYPRKEFFAWGDETEYFYRAKYRSFTISTVTDAIHRHPQESNERKLFFKRFTIPLFENQFKNYCHFRNYSFIYTMYGRYSIFFKFLFKYTWYYIITTRLNITGLIFYWKAAYDGVTGNFSRHKEYMG